MRSVLVLAATAFALSGCAAASPLRSERDDPARMAVLERLSAAPVVVERVPVTLPSGHVVRVEVEERGTGHASRLVVLVHGVMSDRRTWRYVAADLVRDHDVLLVDLPGCGGSDAPDPYDVGFADYAPPALASAVRQAVDARLAARKALPPHVTLVGHSLGAALVLRSLCESPTPARSATLARTDSLVLLSPLDVAFERPDPLLSEIVDLKAYEVDAARALGILQKRVTKSVIESAREGSTPPREEADRMVEILSSPQRRRAGQAILAMASPYREDRRPDWPRIEADAKAIVAVTTPILVVCGERDETIPSSCGFRLACRLPDAWMRTVPGGTHPLPTEDWATCAKAIREFAATKGAGWPKNGVLERP